eukprot:CAMPEP_0118685480 /NCGR_PEP_ID=MMETSP0800-20121206/7270_1 /TAXON_ID=210618 ORGANISM="Striatella unipunctata, Strain CCMP2910" /NCGR_SAMPLE_ID=MMETSP0800 /ASSEMBLY_ACC=CAM_ASM_000638 /LENGTH=189 /DNA_ID=CAMNT_0006582397 /DNA_START=61 /DNA_END=630 /DNA_ORIENTATION=-
MLTRSKVLRGVATIVAANFALNPFATTTTTTTTENNNKKKCDELFCVRHEEPKGVDFASNPSVFGGILRGEVPALTLAETDDLLCFMDKTPRAPLHALVIPKRHIPTLNDLTFQDVELVQEMRALGLRVMKERYPHAHQDKDYVLCFHVPPFNSVDHLHLHVLAPASSMTRLMRYGKYRGPCGVPVMKK